MVMSSKDPNSQSKEDDCKQEEVSLLSSLDLENERRDELEGDWSNRGAPNEYPSNHDHRFHTELICGEARGADQPQQPSIIPGSRDDDVVDVAAAARPILGRLAPPASPADVPRASTSGTGGCYLINQENDDLQKALQMSLEFADDTVTTIPPCLSTVQQSARAPRPMLTAPPMETLGSLDALREIAQRILNDSYENENNEKVSWLELLIPEGSNKDMRSDSAERLVHLIQELPVVLISTLTLTQRKSQHGVTGQQQSDGSVVQSCSSGDNEQEEQQQQIELQSGWHPILLAADQAQQAFNEAWILLFGRKPLVTAHDFYGWWRSSFQFNTTNPRITLGLLQDQGGPCGVLASLQCWIFAHSVILRPAVIPANQQDEALDEEEATRSTASFSTQSPPSISESDADDLHSGAGPNQRRFFSHISRTPSTPLRRYTYSHDGWCPDYSIPNVPTNNDIFRAFTAIFSPCGCVAASSLIWAICSVLYRATPNSLYTIVILSTNCPELMSDVVVPGRDKEGIAGMKDKIKYRIYQMTSIQQVYALYSKFNSDLLLSRASVLGVVLSLVLTRGVKQIRCEVDDCDVPLIGLFGHSSQELVNLFLSGCATTNVFDGSHTLTDQIPAAAATAAVPFREQQEEGLQLRGISRPQIVGYLTELEALHYCEVGKFYKYPLFPIWVIGSPNHFTTIFSLDPRVSRIPASEKLLESLSRAFSSLDLGEAGIIPSVQLNPLLRLAGLLNFQVEAKKVLDQDGVILKSDFINWATQKRLMLQSHQPSPQLAHNSRLQPQQQQQQQQQQTLSLDPPSKFVLYHYNGQGAGGPTLSRILVEPIDISNIQEDDDRGLGLVLRTRWKNTLVAALP